MSAAAPDWPGRAEPDSSHHIPAAGAGPEPGAGPVISLSAQSLLTASLSSQLASVTRPVSPVMTEAGLENMINNATVSTD